MEIDENTKSSLPEHIVQLPGGQWGLWRCIGLRSAGFPIKLERELAAPECATIADQLIQAEKRVQKAQNDALQLVNEKLDMLRYNQEWGNVNERKPLVQALRFLKNSDPFPKLSVANAATADAIDIFLNAQTQVQLLWPDFYQAFDTARTQVSNAIRQIARKDRFREATIWQNRYAFHNSISRLSQKPANVLRKKERQREELAAKYLYRYCTKNETIGFFGPVGWAYFTPQAQTISACPGSDLLAERRIYFEQWCIDTLAQKLAQDKSLQPWFMPRCAPSNYVEGTTLYRPLESPLQIPASFAFLLQACDGSHTAKEIAQKFTQMLGGELVNEREFYALLQAMRDKGLIVWTLEVPLEPHPEKILRRLLESIDVPHLRQSALNALDELEMARTAVIQATGNVQNLNQALHNLENTFTRLTDIEPTRSAGEMYAGRTLVYEDCRRDIEVHVGEDLLNILGPPLSLILTSARWLTFEMAAIYRQIFYQVYNVLSQRTASSTVAFTDFWFHIQPALFFGVETPPPEPVKAIQTDFQKRWAEILQIPKGECRVQFTSNTLRPYILRKFDAPAPGWQFARYHSPDVMIAATSVDAINQNQYELVLGEVHVGTNTLRNQFFSLLHPAAEELLEAVRRDLPQPRIVSVPPRKWLNISSRTCGAFTLAKDFYLAFTSDAYPVSNSRILTAGELVIEDRNGQLVVRTQDGQLNLDIIEVAADALSFITSNFFKLLPAWNYVPRLMIDRLIVHRETWRFPATETLFAQEKSEADRFLAARRWASNYNLPRFVFVRVPGERKPFFLDFESPLAVNIVAKEIRQALVNGNENLLITVAEMLPTPNQTWLPDAKGQSYTSELRIIAVDPVAP